MENSEVQEKAVAGKKYCETATEFNLKNNGKRWEYILIPHIRVQTNMSFNGLINLND